MHPGPTSLHLYCSCLFVNMALRSPPTKGHLSTKTRYGGVRSISRLRIQVAPRKQTLVLVIVLTGLCPAGTLVIIYPENKAVPQYTHLYHETRPNESAAPLTPIHAVCGLQESESKHLHQGLALSSPTDINLSRSCLVIVRTS